MPSSEQNMNPLNLSGRSVKTHNVCSVPCDHEVMGPGNSLLRKCKERLRT
jgi:hypothetical protein